jgi:alkylation response protein AidB-like acyl-CoA dehydrogenase
MLDSDAALAAADVQAFLAATPSPSARELAAAGFVVPHWPAPWGRAASPAAQLAIDEVLAAAGIRRPVNPIGIGWAGPTLLEAGTHEQQQRWLPGLLSGEDFWCQLFSEPGAGSDLASLRTTAVRDGDEWVVTGSKVWTSYAHLARFGILLARTDPTAERHHGISYFVCPMDAPGIEVRPLIDMRGEHTFNEVFLDEVRIPAANLVGTVHDGWRLAKVTLANERVSLSGEGLLWGMGPTFEAVLDLARRLGPLDPVARDAVVRLFVRAEVLRLTKQRLVGAAVAGRQPGPEASVRKALADEVGQEAGALAIDLLGLRGVASGPEEAEGWWQGVFLMGPALTVGGGTSVVQRNIIAERVLGLPRDLEGDGAGARRGPAVP